MTQRRNMLIYFFGKVVPALCALFIMIAGMRFLGKDEFGRYSLLFNSINIAITFFIGWIQQSMLRFSPGVSGEEFNQRGQFVIYSFFSSLLAAASIFFLSIFYFDEPLLNAGLVAIFVFCFSMLAVHLTYLQSQFRPREFAVTESSFYLLTTLALSAVIFLAFPKRMIFFYAGWLIAGISWLIVESIRNRKLIVSSLRAAIDKSFFTKSLQYGFLITAWLMISNLYNVVDRFIIRHYYDFEAVGIYSVVYDFIYRLTGFATLPVLLTLHPVIMKTWNENRKAESIAYIRKAVYLLCLLMVAELAGYLIFGSWIFAEFFHLETAGLTTLIIPLVISSVLWQAALFMHKPLELLFRQRQMISGILISLVCNIVLNIIFIPVYGYQAAAYTTLASTIIYIAYVIVAGSYIKKASS